MKPTRSMTWLAMRKRRARKRGPVFQKLDRDYIASLGVIKAPTLDYSWRRGAHVSNLPSLEGCESFTTQQSVMDPMSLAKESVETRAAIIAKSKRIAIAYNKGGYQYVTDDTDLKSLGSRSKR